MAKRKQQTGKGKGQSGAPRVGTTDSPHTTCHMPLATLSTRQLVPLLPYQAKWVEDSSPLKIVVKARQIGFSFAATLRVVLACLKERTTWILLSKGERQSRLLMEKVQQHIHTCGLVADIHEESYFEGTMLKQLEARFPNGSVIYALPANPDTARGYSGNVTLDEFAFHVDADKIYAALYPSITRGYSLEVISTPNGTQGKFYELAKAAGLTIDDCRLPIEKTEDRPRAIVNRQSSIGNSSNWSGHHVDIYDAARQGLKIDIPLLRAGCEDETAWQQEFCCQFVSTAENFFSPGLLASCLSAEARSDTPLHSLAGAGKGNREVGVGNRVPAPAPYSPLPTPEFFLGIDIGRHHDRTVFWLDEVAQAAAFAACGSSLADGEAADFKSGSPRYTLDSRFRGNDSDGLGALSIGNRQSAIGNLSIARLVRTMEKTPFQKQLDYARQLLLLRGPSGSPLIHRVAIDATGIGAPLAESLAQEFGARVEPVVFTAAVKEDLAYRTRRRMEQGLTLLPDSRDIRRAFSAVKKFVTVSGNVRFDAERTEAGHADEFWAKALADLAAETQPASRLSDGYIASGRPIISPSAFDHVVAAVYDRRSAGILPAGFADVRF